jgi:hypothetical protein
MTAHVSERAPETPEPLLAFIHVPKAGGTTFNNILRIHYPDGAMHRGLSVFEGVEEAQAALRSMTGDAKVRALAGHLTFGLHDLLPAETRYLTMLRDPVERTLSHYGYLVRHYFSRDRSARVKGAGVVPPWLTRPSRTPTLDECLMDRSYIPDNLQTRMLCGLVSPFDELPPHALDQAKRNLLDRFAYVGTTERLEEFVALLNLDLDWPAVAYKLYNKSTRRLSREELPAHTLRYIEERNALDRELHAHAGDLLERALERAGPELELELEVLRRCGTRHRSRGEVERARSAAIIRSLPVEARVEFALTVGELSRAEFRASRLLALEQQSQKPTSLGERLRLPTGIASRFRGYLPGYSRSSDHARAKRA